MAKRVVLAYSGGLDTSVAVRWMIDNLGVEVVASPSTSARATTGTWSASAPWPPAPVEAIVVDAREEFAESTACRRCKANALYEGRYPLVSALSRPVIVKHLVDRGPVPRRRRRRPRLHRQGQRPGALRGVDPGARARPRGDRPGAGWGMTREDSIDYAYDHGIPITATKEKVYSIDDNLWGRAIECGEMEDPWAVPPRACGCSPSPPRPSPATSSSAFEAGVPVSIDGETARADARPHRELKRSWALRLGPDRHGREPPGRHQEPRDLRVPGRAGADHGPRRPRVRSASSATWHREKRASSPATPSWSTTACGSPAEAGARRLRRREPAHVTGEVRLRLEPGSCQVTGRRSPHSLYDYGLATYDAGRQLPPRGLRGLRAPLGPRHRDLGRPPGPTGPVNRPGEGRMMHPLARPVRGRAGRGAAGLHGEPAVRPRLAADDIAGSRAHVRGLGGPACSTTDELVAVLAALDTVGRRARGRHLRVRAERRGHPHRGRAPGHRAGRRRPAPSCTPAAAATTRWPPTCGSTKRELRRGRRVLGSRRCCSTRAVEAGRRPTCPATPTCSGPSPCCSPTTCWPTAGRSPATSTGCSTPGAADVSPLGAGALAGSSLPLDPDGTAADLGFAQRSTTASTP
jgi:argininosuccinate synthase